MARFLKGITQAAIFALRLSIALLVEALLFPQTV